MLTATKKFEWAMAHMLEDHEGLCLNVHGHTYMMEVCVKRAMHPVDSAVIAEGPARGMVVDFKKLKEIVNRFIVDKLDHTFVGCSKSKDPVEQEVMNTLEKYGRRLVKLPYRPTAENMVMHFYNLLEAELAPYGIDLFSVKLYETPTSWAECCAASDNADYYVPLELV